MFEDAKSLRISMKDWPTLEPSPEPTDERGNVKSTSVLEGYRRPVVSSCETCKATVTLASLFSGVQDLQFVAHSTTSAHSGSPPREEEALTMGSIFKSQSCKRYKLFHLLDARTIQLAKA